MASELYNHEQNCWIIVHLTVNTLELLQCTLESSDGFDPVLVRHCLLQLASNSPSDEAEEPVIVLCEIRKVPEFRAHQVRLG